MPADPSRLYDFLALLREKRSGFSAAGQQWLAAYELVSAMADREQWPDAAEDWRTLLAPALCSSPEQQAKFYSLFDTHFRPTAAASPTPGLTPVETADAPAGQKAWKPWAALLLLLATLPPAGWYGWTRVRLPAPPAFDRSFLPRPPLPGTRPVEDVSSILTVYVTTPDGKPIADAYIHYAGTYGKTDPTGSVVARFGEAPGNHYLLVTHTSSQTRVQQIPPRAPSVTVALDPGWTGPPSNTWQSWFLRNYALVQFAGAALPVALAGIWIAWLWRKILEIRNWTAPRERFPRRVGWDQAVELYTGPDIRRLATLLRRRRTEPSQDVDPEPTVEASARAGGFFSPVFANRRPEPEYLVIEERKNPRDHLWTLHDELFARLHDHDVTVQRYSFRNNPQVCVDAKDQVFTLNEIAARHPGHEAWIACEADACVNPVTLEAEPWMGDLRWWRERALLSFTATDPTSLGKLLDMPVCPPTRQGLEDLQGEAERGNRATQFPKLLADRPDHWLGPDPPSAAEFDRLIRQLRGYLGDDGFLCLQGCAVYPGVAWGITCKMTAKLVAEPRVETVLERMCGLPWFRHGFLPDWLRERLVRTLGDERARVLAALKEYLESGVADSQRKESQEFDLRKRRGGGKRVRRDSIYLWFLSGRKLEHLSLQAPASWQRLILLPLAIRALVALLLAVALSGGSVAYAKWLQGQIQKSANHPQTARVRPAGRFPAAMLDVAAGLINVPGTSNGIAALEKIAAIAADVLNVRSPLPATADPADFWKQALLLPGIRTGAVVKGMTPGLVVLGSRTGGLLSSADDGAVDEYKVAGMPKPVRRGELNLGWLDFGAVPLERASSGGRVPDANVRINPIDNQAYVYVFPGKFTMGCSDGDGLCSKDETRHEVEITRGFWIGQTETTQEAYSRVMSANPSGFKGADRPVENVRWDDAQTFCRAVGMRLPTEAEWEYAARAGSHNATYGDLDSAAWYAANSGMVAHPVKRKAPNGWGLYDMLGNVWEWVEDWYGDYSASAARNPNGPSKGTFRLLRGGAWYNNPQHVRVSIRLWSRADVPAQRHRVSLRRGITLSFLCFPFARGRGGPFPARAA